MPQKLMDIATLIRSKNAGPFVMTFDIMFDDPSKYQHVKNSEVLNKGLLSKLYNTPLEQVHFVSSDAAMAAADESHEEEPGDLISFLKEQQWRVGVTTVEATEQEADRPMFRRIDRCR